MGIIDVIGAEHPDIIANAKMAGQHLLAPCPQCRANGNDTKGDNFVITPSKNFAHCFACGYTVFDTPLRREMLRSIELLQKGVPKLFLEERGVYEAALRCKTVGYFDEQLAQEVAQKTADRVKPGIVFWGRDGYKLRPLDKKPKSKNSKGNSGEWAILTGRDKDWLIVEGEIDALTAYQLLGDRFNYLSTGGANNIPNLPAKQVYCIPDNDEAGEKLVETLQSKYTVRVVRVPHKDLNEYYLKDKPTTDDLLNKIKNAETLYIPLAKVIEEVNYLLEQAKGAARGRKRAVAERILADLTTRGEFVYCNNQLYYHDFSTRRVLPVNLKFSGWQELLAERGVYPHEDTYTLTTYHIISTMAGGEARRATLQYGSWYDIASNTLYVDNKDGTILKITASGVGQIYNGDEVLFYREEIEEPLVRLPLRQQEEDPLYSFLCKFNFQEEQMIKLAYTWILAVMFHGFFETRPILIIESVAGSGKTTLAKMLGQVIVGDHFDVSAISESIDSFMAVVSTNQLIVFDNAEKISADLLDYIAMASTGATFQKRKLYHEFDTVRAPSRAWIVFTMMNSSLKRKDIVERAIYLHLQRLKKFKANLELKKEFPKKEIFEQIIYIAQRIIKALQDNDFAPFSDDIRQIRMADFALFLDYVCHVMQWDIAQITTWWLKKTAVTSLEDNLYFMALLGALQMKSSFNTWLSAKQVKEHIVDWATQNSEQIGKREIDILKSIRPKRFWNWIETQAENFARVGYVLEMRTWRNLKQIYIVKTEDAVPIEEVLDGSCEITNIFNEAITANANDIAPFD